LEIEFESGKKNSGDRIWSNVYLLFKNKKKKIKPIQETCNTANQRKKTYELMTGKKYSFEKTIMRKGKLIEAKIEAVITKTGIKILKEEGFPLKFNLLVIK